VEQSRYLELEETLRKSRGEDKPLRFCVLDDVNMAESLKAHILSLVDQLNTMTPGSGDYSKKDDYIRELCKLPIGCYKSLPVTMAGGVAHVSEFLQSAKARLDAAVYGHTDAKDRIIRLMAQWVSNPTNTKGMVIGIEGPMGCGKTTLIKEGICKAMEMPFGFVPLGGCSDGSFLVGHSYTYEGSKCGKICDVLKQTKCMNPIFYFDELDKVSTTHHGVEIVNLLIHLTDPAQSECFQDKYFGNIDLDLSRTVIVFSFNDASVVHPILRDRMTIIRTKGYTASQKMVIARSHIIPTLESQYMMQAGDLTLDDALINHIICNVADAEDGVRNLKRALDDVYSFVNYRRLIGNTTALTKDDLTLPLVMTEALVRFIAPTGKRTDSVSHMAMYC
jgi:ATP-dependent Lon protease